MSTTNNQYLRIRFRDNDFGYPVLCAVRELYDLIVTTHCDVDVIQIRHEPGNQYIFKEHPEAVSNVFKALDGTETLKPILRRLFVSEYIKYSVYKSIQFIESNVWGSDLRNQDDDAFGAKVLRIYKYLNITLEFHDNEDDIDWDNSENISLDLHSGHCRVY